MYSTFPYSTSLYGGLKGFSGMAGKPLIEFNGYSLLDVTKIITSNLKRDHAPSRNLKSVLKPRTNGRSILNDTQEIKLITLDGVIKANTGAELDTLIDEIKKNLITLEGNLDITDANGTVKRYIATLTNGQSMFDRPGNYVTICPFEFQFSCLEPFATSIDYNSKALFGVTDLSKQETVDVQGTFEAEAVLIFVINSAVGVSQLTFTNSTRGEAIEINEALGENDVLIIDGETKEVTLNALPIDYNGVFPVFSVGSNSYTIDIAGATPSINYDVTLKHKTTYL